MSHAGISDKLIKSLIPFDGDLKILDVGHGYGQIGLLMRSIRLTRSEYRASTEIWGVEIYPPYHEMQRKLGIYNHLILGDVRKLTVDRKYFNISIASHIIEHLEKEEGFDLLKKLEDCTKNLIIIVTPKGKVHAEEKDGNKYNEHKSGWTIKDFRSQGFKVYQCTRQVHSRAVAIFAYLWFGLLGKTWNNSILVAIKDMEGF